ncbi:MAG TPA: hypothetical protein VKA40_06780 [Nitrososphaera sp.]|nr:hypothetical protein [Nitrososphaera sp.]
MVRTSPQARRIEEGARCLPTTTIDVKRTSSLYPTFVTDWVARRLLL